MDTSKPRPKERPKKVNLRTPEVMEAVQSEVEEHYRSPIVEYLRYSGNALKAGKLTVRLSKAFGFCYGVERAIDLAYAAAKVFKEQRIFLLGEIIHNPEVNDQLSGMGIQQLKEEEGEYNLKGLTEEDVVIIPAFGAETRVMESLKKIGSQLVDTTCGDVMTVWKRVRQYQRESVTSIIHGKAWHEETKATASRAIGEGGGHYLVVYNLEETEYICEYIRKGGDRESFYKKFKGAHSPGFDPDLHLCAVGVANQTTMMRGETEEVQKRIRQAIADRYGIKVLGEHFRFFDTICGATQERQDALRKMLDEGEKIDILIVVGGYNSSNTSHLAEMGEEMLPTYFIKNSEKLITPQKIRHWDLHKQEEVETKGWLKDGEIVVGVTAGASCPNNLIEETVERLFVFRDVDIKTLIPKNETEVEKK